MSDSKLVQEWFTYSRNDLISARHLFDDIYPMKHDNTFSEILDACSDLTPYGVAVRYSNELAVDDVIAKSAIEKAQIVYGFCTGKCSGTSLRGGSP